jgi:hypothetical protein
MEGEVLGDSGDKRSGILKDLCPFLNSLDVVSHTLACVKNLRDLECDNSELEGALSDIVPSIASNLGNSEFDFLEHKVATLVAGFDLLEMVLAGHTVEEASNKFRRTSDRNVRDRHYKVKLIILILNNT